MSFIEILQDFSDADLKNGFLDYFDGGEKGFPVISVGYIFNSVRYKVVFNFFTILLTIKNLVIGR